MCFLCLHQGFTDICAAIQCSLQGFLKRCRVFPDGLIDVLAGCQCISNGRILFTSLLLLIDLKGAEKSLIGSDNGFFCAQPLGHDIDEGGTERVDGCCYGFRRGIQIGGPGQAAFQHLIHGLFKVLALGYRQE